MVGSLFSFDANTETPESAARRRAIAEAILGHPMTPQNAGQGWQAIANGIVANVQNRRANATEQAGKAGAGDLRSQLIAAITGQNGSFPPAPTTSSANSSDYANQRVSQAFDGNRETFVSSLMPSAIEASQRTGVDPRIIVAQAAQETGWGKHAPGNNYFGIKSHGKGGGSNLATTEYVNGKPVRVNDSFRGYASPEDSVRGYADFLLENPRYRSMMEAQGLDAQLQALGKSGYATDPNYANSVGAIARSIPAPNATPQQVASLNPSIGLPDVAPTPVPSPGPANVQAAGGKGDRMAMAQASPVPMQPGPLQSTDPAHRQFIDRMSNPQPMTGGVPMPMQPMPSAQPTQPPQQIAQAQGDPDLSRLPVMAGGSAGALQPGQRPPVDMGMLLQVMSNQFMDEGTKAFASNLIQQQLQTQDPARQLDMDYKRAQIGKLTREANGPPELGLNPQYGVDANGNPVLLQLGKNGQVVQSKMPDGVSLSKEPIKMDAGTHFVLLDPITRQPVGTIPKENYQEAFDKGAGGEAGKARGQAAASLPADLQRSEQTIAQIDQLLASKGLYSIVGSIDQYRPSWTLGAKGKDALARLKQLQGGAFLEAYGLLKGAGQITEIEGTKAENAMARMDRALSENEFRQALKDFRDAVAGGMDKLRQKAGMDARQPVSIGGYTIEQVD